MDSNKLRLFVFRTKDFAKVTEVMKAPLARGQEVLRFLKGCSVVWLSRCQIVTDIAKARIVATVKMLQSLIRHLSVS